MWKALVRAANIPIKGEGFVPGISQEAVSFEKNTNGQKAVGVSWFNYTY